MTFQPGDSMDRSNLDEETRQALERDLTKVVRGEVRFDGATRGVFATDSSNYRQMPLGVVFPVDEEDVLSIVKVCRRHNAPFWGVAPAQVWRARHATWRWSWT